MSHPSPTLASSDSEQIGLDDSSTRALRLPLIAPIDRAVSAIAGHRSTRRVVGRIRIAQKPADRVVQQAAIPREVLSAPRTGKHDGGDVVCLQVVTNKTAHDMTGSERDRRAHSLIIQNEDIHAPVYIDRLVRGNSIDGRERRIRHRGVDFVNGISRR